MIAFLTILAFLLWIIYRKFEPFIEFSKKNKHCQGVAARFLKAGYEDCYEEVMGPVIRARYDSFWLGHIFAVILHIPDDIKIVMNSDKCFEKFPTYEFYFKYGLFTEGGEKYKLQKKSLNPLFSPSNLKTLIPIINKNFTHFMKMNEQNLEGKEFYMKHLASKFTINTVLGTLIGIGTKFFPDIMLEEVIENVDTFLKSCSGRLFKMWMHPEFMYKLTKEYQFKKTSFRKILDMIEELFEDNNVKNIDGITYLSCMKNHLDKMKYEEYSESLTLFLGAAYETTAGTILAIFFLLSLNPEKQQNLYNEISSILTSTDDEVTEKMMNEMHYLDLVIKESLRLLPVALFSARLTTDDVEFSTFTAPKGSMLILPTMDIHRDKKVWGEDALEFKPERFEPENYKNIHPYAYFPFSSGGRMCPGYKYSLIAIKIFVSRYIMKYRVSTNMKFEDLEYVLGLTMDFKTRPLFTVTKR